MIDSTPLDEPDEWPEDAPDCVCLECGALNKVRTYLINTPTCYEYETVCTVCGSDEIAEDSMEASALAKIIQDLRKELAAMKAKEKSSSLDGVKTSLKDLAEGIAGP
jgi:hypothetical protein